MKKHTSLKLLLLHAALFLFLIYCASTKEILPEPVPGESFYSETTKTGYDILKYFNWKLVRIDTINQKDSRPVYLFHYVK